MTVSENIKRLRKEKGITQKQLGIACGMAESTIRQYELGLRNPKLETIHKIADGLGVPIGDLIDVLEFSLAESERLTENTGYATRVLPSYRYDILLDIFDKLNEKGQDATIEQARIIKKIPEYRKPDQD